MTAEDTFDNRVYDEAVTEASRALRRAYRRQMKAARETTRAQLILDTLISEHAALVNLQRPGLVSPTGTTIRFQPDGSSAPDGHSLRIAHEAGEAPRDYQECREICDHQG